MRIDLSCKKMRIFHLFCFTWILLKVHICPISFDTPLLRFILLEAYDKATSLRRLSRQL